ncbi:MAG: zf-HC2 domain-containing protein [Planctomycetaceae bacterium]|nr:zf-HC2 domain-containing protein [Planctomycetaceae bacterium]MCB9952945.1 zf-HC2 domain-containing protein [Planctomycetaceae bacterium]
MNCREAQNEIALLVGDDLDDVTTRKTLKKHVAQCPSCHAHYRSVRQAVAVLTSSDRAETFESRDSLWPNVQKRLKERRPRTKGPGFRKWWPLGAFMAACVVVVFLIQPPLDTTVNTEPVGRGMFPDMTPHAQPEKPPVASGSEESKSDKERPGDAHLNGSN